MYMSQWFRPRQLSIQLGVRRATTVVLFLSICFHGWAARYGMRTVLLFTTPKFIGQACGSFGKWILFMGREHPAKSP
ncbi:predicted protein [Histoplasma mississippiense (nom. inval.)]|uniref:predicted protein n=1 Tax=Ajellomyces capsulatus (strain NAm1 / WU24) TaxID=2059318 RepID=UPI000157BA25|nr:predicted protein [Histoplasma mississippiense (nom. inval.)]EDN03393.1 predicted protein [Histoplasma mississippiense (nom. inval.)]